MINNFKEFVNESSNNVFDDLSDMIINRFDDNEYNFEISEYSKSSHIRKFKIKNLKIKFILVKDKVNYCNGLCNANDSSIIDDYLVNSEISFNIGYNNLNKDFRKYIHSVIKHETLHLYQIYNLKLNNKFKPESWVIGTLLPTFRKFMNEKYTKNILDLLYQSLSHEIYSQLYQYFFYKKDGLDYNYIDKSINELNSFVIKDNLNDIEIIEINNIRKYILKSLRNSSNKNYVRNVDKSLWNEDDIQIFLNKLSIYFKEKSELLKRKKNRIDRELDIDTKVKENMNNWISLPTNFFETKINHFEIIDSIISDVL
jgi:hypothetical protein